MEVGVRSRESVVSGRNPQRFTLGTGKPPDTLVNDLVVTYFSLLWFILVFRS